MAGTDKRQQEAQEAARRLTDLQAQSQGMSMQRQETARRAALEAARLRQSKAARAGGSARRAAASRTQEVSGRRNLEKHLGQDVENMMKQESFGDLVYVDTKSLPRQRQPGEYRTGYAGREPSARRTGYGRSASSARRTDYGRNAREEEEWEDDPSGETLRRWGQFGQWFQMLCWMHIPVFGFWYMVVTALRKKNPEEKRAFAKAFVLYRMLVLLLALAILYVFYRMGLDFFEQILSYVDLHS